MMQPIELITGRKPGEETVAFTASFLAARTMCSKTPFVMIQSISNDQKKI